MTFREVNSVPFQPLQAISRFSALMYSVFLCQARPKEIGGEPGSRTAAPPLSTNTPPTDLPSSLPKSETNVWPAPKANEVGVDSPEPTSWTAFPLVDFGGGGPAAIADEQ